jgi:sterol desaturase/sphingolipid hydroxylase (fatty acid hydroxylase superfamily)
MQTAYKSIRLFKSSFLEKFSHIHPITPLVVWGPVAAYFFYRAISVFELPALTIAGLSVAGLIVWTLAEYSLHRWLFHFKPEGEWQERLVFIMHGIHHSDPMDPTRLVMPPVVALLMAIPLYSLFKFVFLAMSPMSGNELVAPFFGAFLVGYLIYDYTHFAVHHFKPRTRWGKAIKQSHMVHHYVNHDLRWGVSSPLWDHVFGTYQEPVRAPSAAKNVSKGAAVSGKSPRRPSGNGTAAAASAVSQAAAGSSGTLKPGQVG